MNRYAQMLAVLRRTPAAERIYQLYGTQEGNLARQLTRYSRLVKAHDNDFHVNDQPLYLISSPGRTEICGNHTDHQHGRVLTAAINRDMIACVTARQDLEVHLHSDGFPEITVDLADLRMQEQEKFTSEAIVRGIAALYQERGGELHGFDAVVQSDVPSGSGLSSSASFEVLIATIFETLHGKNILSPIEKAMLCQQVENTYFGKPSGLMDQLACSCGGLLAVDFKDGADVQPLDFSFNQAGYSMVIVQTGGNHADMNDEYAAIVQEMQQIANAMGEKWLRGVRQEQLIQHAQELRDAYGERALMRALHYCQENARVKQQTYALKNHDMGSFLTSVIESGESSWMLLQNVVANGRQPLALALALSSVMLRGCGAWRVHGGGFAGSILTFVPLERLDEFMMRMEQTFGHDCCFPIDVRATGGEVAFSVLEDEE